VQRAQLNHVFAYLLKPLKPGELATAIAVAMARFKELQFVQMEAATLKQALRDRKIVERAKGIVMEQAGISENDAFRRLQKRSWETNEKIVRIAEMIIFAEGAVAPFAKRVDAPASTVDGPPTRVTSRH
jgi:response regulator NasT